MILFRKREGCVPNESAKEEGDKAREEVNVVRVVWLRCGMGGRSATGEGRMEEKEKSAVRLC